MNSGPLHSSVSVVIGSYNAAAWIRGTIDSVLAQTHPVSEVIVADDGSTDATATIVRSYGAPVRLLQEEHRGRPRRNLAIEASSGSLIAFIDADDLWQPAKLERQIARMNERKAEWATCEADWVDADRGHPVRVSGGTLVEGDILESLFTGNFIVASTAVVSRSVLEEVGGFDESVDVAPAEDWDLWLRIAARYPIAGVLQPLVTVRLHDDSFLASTPLSDRVRSLENVISRAATRDWARLESIRPMALHNTYFGAGVGSFRHGQMKEARGYFMRAWKEQPGDIASLAYVGLTWLPAAIAASLVGLKRRIVNPT